MLQMFLLIEFTLGLISIFLSLIHVKARMRDINNGTVEDNQKLNICLYNQVARFV